MRNMKFAGLTLLLLIAFVTSFAQVAPISGIMSICAGSTTTLGDITTGGSWSSSNTSIATIDTAGSVTGIAPGVVTISYTAGSTVTATFTVNALPASITGSSVVCAGGNITLSDISTGGSWSSSSPSVATVSSTGVVTGVTSGPVSISYSLAFGCSVSAAVMVNTVPGPIVGTSSLCNGASAPMTDPASPGGTWSSSGTAISINATSGNATGTAAGTDIVTYTLPTGCQSSHTVNVLMAPGATSGPSAICVAGTANLTNAVTGGNWSSVSPAIALVGSSSGTVTGLTPGIATLIYTLGTGCATTATVSVNPLPSPVYGAMGVCAGGTTTLSDATPGGSWSSANTSIATVGTSGLISAFTVGTVAISYTNVLGCASAATVTVYAAPAPIAGPTTVCNSSVVSLSDAATGGNWSSSTPSTAAINATSGSLLAILPGTTTITYALGTGCSTTVVVTVNAAPVPHSLTGGGNYCAGGSGVPIGLNASEPGNTYQLFMGTMAVGSPVTGTGSALDFGPQTIPGSYTVVASNLSGCTHSMLGAAPVTVNPLPNIFGMTGGGNYCDGSAAPHVSLTSSQTGISYQLYRGTSLVGVPITGTGSALDFGAQSAAGSYLVVANNVATGCTSAMSGAAMVNVNPLPAIFHMAGGGGYCDSGAGVPVKLDGSQSGTLYKLYRGSTYTGIQVAGTDSALDFGHQTIAGTYMVVASNPLTGCSVYMTGSAAVAINPLPVEWTVTSSPSGYCAGGPGVHITLSGSQTGVMYNLYYGGTIVTSMPGTGALSGLDFGIHSAPGAYTAIAVNSTTGCSKTMAGTGNVIINSLPAVHTVIGGGTYCSGGTGVAVKLDASTPGILYKLYRGSALMDSLTGTGSLLNFGLHMEVGAYNVTGTNALTGCSTAMASTAMISVTPTVTPLVNINASTGDTVCAGTLVTYVALPVNGGTAPAYNWSVNGVSTTSTGSTFDFTPINGDVIGVQLISNATCALPATATAAKTMQVVTVPSIAGSASICLGATTGLTNAMPGGIWSTNNPSVAIISTVGGTTGVVTGLSAGTANMTYTVALGCYNYETITVNALPAATATAVPAGCGGNSNLLASGGSSYSWLPAAGLSCNTCANTIANPSATTTYSVTVTNGLGCSAIKMVTVNGNRISGYISYTGTASDVFKVWLIQFNPADSSLIAMDSTTTCMDNGTPYYEFDGKPAGSYMVKAKLLGQTPGTSGYIPTYSLNTPYWYAAATTVHHAGTDTLHISMVYGTVPPGPGFIGGLISAGAGKGTSGDIAAQGMIVYLVDAVTNYVLTYTYTDEAGAYSFSNIAEGNYLIMPESYSYATVPSPVIALSSGSDSATAVNFRQFVNSKVIRPLITSNVKVGTIANTGARFTIYPNPAHAQLNLAWGAEDDGLATVTLINITGQVVYSVPVNIYEAKNNSSFIAPITLVDLSGLGSGMYILSIKGDHSNHSEKVVIR